MARRGLDPDMRRNQDLAGKTVKQGNYTITYDDMGYATKGRQDGGRSATDRVHTTHANDSPIHQQMYEAAQRGDWDSVGSIGNGLIGGTGTNYISGDASGLNNYMQELQNEFGYNANDYYAKRYDDVYGQGAWADPNFRPGGTIDPAYASMTQQAIAGGYMPAPGGSKPHSGALNQLISMAQGGGYPGFSPAKPPEWGGSKWDGILDDLSQQLIGMTYDKWTQGDQYQSLAKRYGDQGRMAMQDVLGQVASRTGGMASSYATSAAAQQQNEYLARLEDEARGLYDDERRGLLNDAQLAGQNAQREYGRYLDELNQYNRDQELAYRASRDAAADQRYEAELKMENDLRRAEMLAQTGDFSGYKALGFSDADIKAMTSGYNAQQVSKTPGRRRSAEPPKGGTDWSGVVAYAESGGDPLDYIGANYKSMGFSSVSQAKSAWKVYEHENGSNGEGGEDLTVDSGSIIDLGFGPISPERLSDLQKAGVVEEYEEGGKIKFRRTGKEAPAYGGFRMPFSDFSI